MEKLSSGESGGVSGRGGGINRWKYCHHERVGGVRKGRGLIVEKIVCHQKRVMGVRKGGY